MSQPDPIAWSRQMFATLADGGIWALPRSGLVFRKDGKALVLQAKLPGDFPVDQEEDFECIKRHFADIGVPVRKETK